MAFTILLLTITHLTRKLVLSSNKTELLWTDHCCDGVVLLGLWFIPFPILLGLGRRSRSGVFVHKALVFG